MSKRENYTLGRWLLSPFTFTAGGLAMTAGLVIMLISAAIGSLSNTHFDGVLDTHSGMAMPFWVYLAEVLIDWLSLAGVLWIAGLIFAPNRFRAIDLFGTQALARWPFFLVSLIVLLPGYAQFNETAIAYAQAPEGLPSFAPWDIAAFSIAALVMLVATGFFVAYAWQSYRISCDFRGPKAVVSFVVGLILAEILSKFAILFLFKAV